MTDDQNITGDQTSPEETKNPYEDADPIPVIGGQPHHRQMQEQGHTRSRSVQSARDAARNQDRITNMTDGVSHVNPVRTAASSNRQNLSEPSYILRTRRRTNFGIIAAAIIAAIVVLSGLLWWINRPVPVTVNGSAAEVRVGSTLYDVLHEEGINVNPGNYVTVSNRVLETSMGHKFTATINGEQLSPEAAEQYRISGNEAIDYTDGTDIVEEFTFESEPIMPYLKMEGPGYSLQYISQWGYMGELQHRHGKESGESADVVVKEAQDCVITCLEPYIEGDTKYVALTFDDGPLSPYTEQYLDIMAQYGIKATFFNLGENTQQNPDLARRVVSEGHQLCSHTMAHNQLTAVDEQTVYDEITRAAEAIEQVTGVYTTHIRPPYGDFTERSWLGSRGSITAAIRWNADSEDWRTPGADAIVENALASLHSGTIILMHDGGGDRSQDVEALPMLIERLQSEGYQFVTIADLMRACGLPEDVCSGTGSMPQDAVWPEEIHPDDIAAAASA